MNTKLIILTVLKVQMSLCVLICDYEVHQYDTVECSSLVDIYDSVLKTNNTENGEVLRLYVKGFGHDRGEEMILKNTNLDRIDSYTLSKMGPVKNLDLSGNPRLKIDAEDFRIMENLHTLKMSGTQMDLEGLKFLKKLKVLDISHQNYSFSNSSAFDNLAILDMSNNKEIDFTTFAITRKLKTLKASNIKVILGSTGFKRSNNLRTLILSNAQITEIPSKTFMSDTRFTFLDLSFNNITENGLTKLPFTRHLNLSHNLLTELNDPDTFPTSIQVLDLSYNKISNIPPTFFTKLRELSYLSLASNQLGTVFIRYADVLQQVDLSNNILGTEENTFIKLPESVEILKLARNGFKTLDPSFIEDLPKLYNLDVSHNQIDFIPIELTQALQKLQVLNLKNNTLKDIPKELIYSENLTDLIISCNYIFNLPVDSNLEKGKKRRLNIFAYGNPWKCPCIEDVISQSVSFEFDAKYFTDGTYPFCNFGPETCNDNPLSNYEVAAWTNTLRGMPC